MTTSNQTIISQARKPVRMNYLTVNQIGRNVIGVTEQSVIEAAKSVSGLNNLSELGGRPPKHALRGFFSASNNRCFYGGSAANRGQKWLNKQRRVSESRLLSSRHQRVVTSLPVAFHNATSEALMTKKPDRITQAINAAVERLKADYQNKPLHMVLLGAAERLTEEAKRTNQAFTSMQSLEEAKLLIEIARKEILRERSSNIDYYCWDHTCASRMRRRA